ERRAGVVMPDLVGIDPMPVRALAGLQQEVDGGRGAARLVGRAVHLAKMPALGMRLQPEAGNDLGGDHAEVRPAAAPWPSPTASWPLRRTTWRAWGARPASRCWRSGSR